MHEERVKIVMARIANCTNCAGTGWVCEEHTDKPWDKDLPNGCECNAGAPCGVCNPCDHDNPPRMPAGAKVIFDEDGYRH